MAALMEERPEFVLGPFGAPVSTVGDPSFGVGVDPFEVSVLPLTHRGIYLMEALTPPERYFVVVCQAGCRAELRLYCMLDGFDLDDPPPLPVWARLHGWTVHADDQQKHQPRAYCPRHTAERAFADWCAA